MKVAVLGNIAGVAQDVVIALRERGIEADLFMTRQEYDVAMKDLAAPFDVGGGKTYVLDPGPSGRGPIPRIVGAMRKSVVAAKLLRYDLIHAHTGSLSWSLLPHLLYVRGGLRPYLAFATGSDFREMARHDQGRDGILMREFFRNAGAILLLNADMVLFREEIGFARARFFPFMIDEKKFAPTAPIKLRQPGQLELFMMSNLDFGITDARPGRNSLKANDRVLHALAQFISEGGRARLVVIDRGPDREVAKQLVSNLGLQEHVVFRAPMSEQERIRAMAEADVVLDQFHVGAFGLGALEAMSMGLPLITYVVPEGFTLCYGDREVPFVNASETQDICKALGRLSDPSERHELSTKARKFILECHSRVAVGPQLEKLYADHALIAGNRSPKQQ